jgi:hypothetical protein
LTPLGTSIGLLPIRDMKQSPAYIRPIGIMIYQT